MPAMLADDNSYPEDVLAGNDCPFSLFHGQFRACFLVKLCNELVRLSHFFQPGPRSEIKAKLRSRMVPTASGSLIFDLTLPVIAHS